MKATTINQLVNEIQNINECFQERVVELRDCCNEIYSTYSIEILFTNRNEINEAKALSDKELKNLKLKVQELLNEINSELGK